MLKKASPYSTWISKMKVQIKTNKKLKAYFANRKYQNLVNPFLYI